MANPATGCRCGSGGHPRRCVIHPHTYDVHIAEMNFYDALHSDEPEGTFAEHVADLRRRYAALETANRSNLTHRNQEEDHLRAEAVRYALRDAIEFHMMRCVTKCVATTGIPDETVADAFLTALVARGFAVAQRAEVARLRALLADADEAKLDVLDETIAERDELRAEVAMLREALALSEVDVALERTWCRRCRTEGRGRGRGRGTHPHDPGCVLAATEKKP